MRNKLFYISFIKSVSEDVPHGEPDVLHLGGLVEELLPLALSLLQPVPPHPVVHPGPLDVDGGGVLHELGALGRPEIPESVHVLVLRQVLGHVVPGPGQDVDDPAGQVARLEYLSWAG